MVVLFNEYSFGKLASTVKSESDKESEEVMNGIEKLKEVMVCSERFLWKYHCVGFYHQR